MPLYEYECTKCHARFERIQKYSDPEPTKCPKCRGRIERVISAPAAHFKGSGFYVTDYARRSESGGGSGGGAEDKGKSGAEAGSSGDKGGGGSSSGGEIESSASHAKEKVPDSKGGKPISEGKPDAGKTSRKDLGRKK